MTSKMEYLDAFHEEGLNYHVHSNYVELWNLKELDGMQVAELLTYLFDDGYDGFGTMMGAESSPEDKPNGYLQMYKRSERYNNDN